VALCPGNVLTPDLIGDICTRPLAGATQPEAPLAEQSLENVERAHVLRVLEATHWHRGKACEILGVSAAAYDPTLRDCPPAARPGRRSGGRNRFRTRQRRDRKPSRLKNHPADESVY